MGYIPPIQPIDPASKKKKRQLNEDYDMNFEEVLDSINSTNIPLPPPRARKVGNFIRKIADHIQENN